MWRRSSVRTTDFVCGPSTLQPNPAPQQDFIHLKFSSHTPNSSRPRCALKICGEEAACAQQTSFVAQVLAAQSCPFAVQACQKTQIFPLKLPLKSLLARASGLPDPGTCTRSVGMSTAIKAALLRIFFQALQDLHFMWGGRALRPLTPFPTILCTHAQTILADSG
ncbi:hypothetical protein C8J57DRAFT_1391698 [Mycena rebaudengoi]|nr:hypothetical protein C8J57DRAFT_1391698 [Mycena rebaudengoi]